MGDFFLRLLEALRKPDSGRAAFLGILIVTMLSLLPLAPSYIEKVKNQYAVHNCEDTVVIVEAIAWYNAPQSMASLRSFLLQYYHPYERNMSRAEVKALVDVLLISHMEQYLLKLDNLNLCFDNVGSWYRETFEFEKYSAQIVDIILLEQDYDTLQSREILINRLVNLIEATHRSYQQQMSTILREKVKGNN